MLADKQIISKAVFEQTRLEQARLQRAKARHAQSGQSVIVAVIVLFLLLFLGAIFIALIAGNLRNTQRAVQTSASGRFGEAGINYLDQQLITSPEGADWRPLPDNIVSEADPDYFWLKPYDPTTGQGGFTRVNFGGPTPTAGNIGGRALVRISYRPNYPIATGAVYPANVPPPAEVNKYIRLEAVGRAGQINPNDPTTYGNSDALNQRVELVAYKSIGVNEFVRQITNKNNKPVTATLGAPFPVYDHDTGTTVSRNIESIYNGPVRVNAGLSFYGVNRFTLNPTRNDSLEVAGPINFNKVSENLGTATNPPTVTDPTQVYVTTPGVTPPSLSNVFPSQSAAFTTLGGLVRDNPRGAETINLAADLDANKVSYANLRSVGRTAPPVLDAPTGANGLTRYRALTRNSAPLDNAYLTANPFPANAFTTVPGFANFAPAIGWGTGLYLNNPSDVQQTSETLTNSYSLRSDWLNNDPASSGGTFWKGDANYVPPAVTITLTPRYMILQRSAQSAAQGRRGFRFRSPSGATLGDTIVRYTGVTGAGAPATNITESAGNPATKLEGYPADKITTGTGANTYNGDFVIYAEGNIRIRGTIGGYDSESKASFIRHLTVVSGGTIYVDGNVLRDNIDPGSVPPGADASVHGKSSIALLAHDYVAVNTTQFFTPDVAGYASESANGNPPYSLILPNPDGGQLDFNFRTTFGPVADPANGNLITPAYATGGAGVQPATLFLRHGVSFSPNAANVVIKGGINLVGSNYVNLLDFAPANGFGPTGNNNPEANSLLLTTPANAQTFTDDAFVVPPAYFQNPLIGSDNVFTLSYDTARSQVSYRLTRFAVAPLDIRIEALMYAQEGSFFIIPGPWFNPDQNDTFATFVAAGKRPLTDEVASQTRRQINPLFPFYKEPMDIRITFFGAITENLPAEIGDQGAWQEKWGWVPDAYGSTGLTGVIDQGANQVATAHGRNGIYKGPGSAGGNGIVYDFDERAIAPYYQDAAGAFAPIRPNPNFANLPAFQQEPLPLTPRLPVAPGLLYYGQNPNRGQ